LSTVSCDLHRYGLLVEPFNYDAIDHLILGYLRTLADLPSSEIAERWLGIYAKIPGKTELVCDREPGVTIIDGDCFGSPGSILFPQCPDTT